LRKSRGEVIENLEQEMRLPPAFFNAMETLVKSFHGRGVAHCDLKRAPNTLVGFGRDALHRGLGRIHFTGRTVRIPPLNMIFRRFMRDDEMAIVKLALRHCPDAVSSEKIGPLPLSKLGEKR
jgi:hypothetical protein